MGHRYASITLQQGAKTLIQNKAFSFNDSDTFQKIFDDKSAGFVGDNEFIVNLTVGPGSELAALWPPCMATMHAHVAHTGLASVVFVVSTGVF